MADILDRLKAALADRCRLERGIGSGGTSISLPQNSETFLSNSYALLVACFAAAWLGCADAADHSGTVVRDSAGITIVESAAGLWSAEEAWRLSDEPTVTIGVMEGPEEYQLYRARWALKLADGRIVVQNSGTSELRFYDSEGRYLSATGREGSGPGEFQEMGEVWQLGDSLVVHDFGLARVSVFDSEGGFARSFMLSELSDGALPMPLAVFQDRSLLAQRMGLDSEIRSGFKRDTTLYLRYTLEGVPIDTLGAFSGDEGYVRVDEVGVFGLPAPFGRRSQHAVSGSFLYFGSTDTYQIETYSSDGTLKCLIRRPIPNRPVTDADIEEYERPIRERPPRPGPFEQAFQQLRRSMTYPETMPAHGRLLVDAAGNLWVAEYDRRRNHEARWTVFDPDGRMLGTVETPVNGRILQIGPDYVLGVWLGELDVEQVRVYDLLKRR